MIEFDDDGVVSYKRAIRTKYNYDRDAVSRETALECKDETRTQQQFKDECDINVILERFGVTGLLPQSVKVPLQEDFLEATTFQEALHVMMAAEDAFMQMPSDVRKRFDNDPALFVDWVSKPENLEEAGKMGLAIERPKAAEPMAVRVIGEKAPEGGGKIAG